MSDKITFVIFTFNEERRIERVIKNLKDFGNVVIADNKSTDRTQEIALYYGCEVLIREKNYVYVENQELVDIIYERITTDWIYWAFADEMVEKKTLLKIQEIVNTNKYDIINIHRKNYFYGDFLFNLYDSATSRVFKKHAIDFKDNVIHGMGKPTVSTERIYTLPQEYFLHQFINYTAASYLNAVNRYTEEEAKSGFKSKKSMLYFFLLISKNIVKNYFLGGGYKMSFSALALTELTICYEIVKNLKSYEAEGNLTRQTIEQTYDTRRDAILQEFEINA